MNKCTRCGEVNPAEIHTCSPQTKAQRLADILQHKIPSIECLEVSADELRRLDALNAELVGVLQKMDAACAAIPEEIEGYLEQLNDALVDVRAALAKAKGEA